MNQSAYTYLQSCGALWRYAGSGPHAVYTLGGDHSDFYFNSEVLNQSDESIMYIIEQFLSTELAVFRGQIDYVCSYSPYGDAVARGIARFISATPSCLESGKFSATLSSKDRVLMVADDIYTGGSLNTLKNELQKINVQTHDLIFVFGNFSGGKTFGNQRIVSVIEAQIQRWPAIECPLCRGGSEAIDARKNWHRFQKSLI